ncbi:carbohydrate ABC transporter permease [Actinopolymorpha rutila]|uniref:Multiple sugar transport system permease protein n=2 Tax=Actinopolymorpha TaxID=117156 RepID=A0A852ZPS4_9ACTN|nr:carbohydrate ABC transporter permease [Actinopolymorpha rutila]NYH91459.1 multiple sugar transport system permease protein [Actinopolymorpha rutila]
MARSAGLPAGLVTLGRTGRHVVLALVGLAFVVPVLALVSTSLKTQEQNLRVPPMWIPVSPHFANYAAAFQTVPVWTFFRNSLFVAAVSVVGVAVSSALVAYGFSHIRWRGRNVVFVLVISTMLLPYEVTMISQYIMFANLGWVNTFLPLTVPSFFGVPFYIFMLRQFFLRIPVEMTEAARIDGASELRIFASIVLPLAIPALSVVGLLQFVASWNDFLGPLIYLNDPNLYTLSLGMHYFRTSLYQTELGPQAAYAFMIALPVIVVFFLAQRRFIQGIALTGLKG